MTNVKWQNEISQDSIWWNGKLEVQKIDRESVDKDVQMDAYDTLDSSWQEKQVIGE